MLTRAMHDAIPHSQVIWYDSVTVEGKLEWQNELNDLNRLVSRTLYLNISQPHTA